MDGFGLYAPESRFDPFSVMLFKALQVVAFLFFLALIAMNPRSDGKALERKAEFMITMAWPDMHPDDVDLYVQDPADELVWYNQRSAGFMSLERDDRGETNDFIRVNGQKMWSPIRQEIVSVRGILAGEYTVNVHLYQHTAKVPVPVSVTVEKLNPAVSVIYYDTIDLDHTDEEKTAVRFTLADDGSVVRTSSTQRSLLDTIGWKRTFRTIRR
jgi:hypothetical protein